MHSRPFLSMAKCQQVATRNLALSLTTTGCVPSKTRARRLKTVLNSDIIRTRRRCCFGCCPSITRTQVLSLSNNKLRDLGSFAPLVNLVELNINFNAVTSLQGLACPGLQKLYLSNNLLANAARLRGFPKLQTLCLFNNIFPDLNSALEPLR